MVASRERLFLNSRAKNSSDSINELSGITTGAWSGRSSPNNTSNATALQFSVSKFFQDATVNMARPIEAVFISNRTVADGGDAVIADIDKGQVSTRIGRM